MLLLRTTLRTNKQQIIAHAQYDHLSQVPGGALTSQPSYSPECAQLTETLNSTRCLEPSEFIDPVKPILLVEPNQRQNISFIS